MTATPATDSDRFSHAAVVDLPCFWQAIAAHLPRSGWMLQENGGRIMDPITISVVLALGFAAGYGVRDWKSRKRRRRYAERNEMAGVFGP